MNVGEKKISVLVLKGHINLLPFIVNCLSQVKSVDIYVISNNKNEGVGRSKKIKNISYYPNTIDDIEWVSNLNKELEKFEIDLILPIDEYGISTLIKYKDLLHQSDKLVLLPELDAFYLANNKGRLSKHLDLFNIPAPKSVLYNKNEICKEPPIEFPILMKPLEGLGGGKGINLFNDEASLKSFFLSNKVDYPYLIQNYIKGYDIDCSVLCKNGDILAFTIQKGTLAGDSEFVPNIGLDFLFEEDLYNVVEKLMNSLNWSGVAHIDMRYDESDKKFKVIEINPRYWETTEGSEIAGVNFPYLHCLTSLNLSFELPKYKHVKYLNLKGLSKTIRTNGLFLFRLNFIFNNTPVKYYLKDPLPLLFIIYYKIKNMFRG
ncbi:ATP-grasp domain-containing protein [Thalassobellus suaedae]|uniref:ATP-grasp domain-containing protein n=1 Tax=Thalassobellus suaedae TaxID=3074124 RepID=A0ABY9Y2T4_9FLAO|nr:ATP-grasp domain-containing protein [Flavobacteriaceae bacterium HL-DH10]